MELIDRVRVQVKAGRHNDRYEIYRKLYEEISGKSYGSKCGTCASKYLYRYLKNWYDNVKP